MIEKLKNYIKDCTKIHNNEYDYSLVGKTFKNQRSHVDIICFKHGIFNQLASNHKRGQKCRKCRDKMRSKKTRRTKKEFFDLLTNHHLEKYDYSLMKNYNNSSEETFICPKHGAYTQKVVRHINTGGCYLCGRESTGENNKKSFNKQDIIGFAINANITGKENKIILGKKDIYFYDSLVTIDCQHHGKSKITVRKLKNGTSCKECRFKGYSKSSFVDFCKLKNKDKVIVYKILIFNNKESFFKIGITSNSIKTRFRKLKKQTGYSYKTIKSIITTPDKAWSIESEIKKLNSKHKYIPKVLFAGHSECFKIIEYDI